MEEEERRRRRRRRSRRRRRKGGGRVGDCHCSTFIYHTSLGGIVLDTSN